MKRIILTAAVLANLITLGHAGLKTPYPVFVTAGSGGGSFATARSAANPNSMMRCRHSPMKTSFYAHCIAVDAAGATAFCNTTDQNLVEGIRSANSDAHLEFYFNAAGECTSLRIGNYSDAEPKVP